jgi:hypothetical protein
LGVSIYFVADLIARRLNLFMSVAAFRPVTPRLWSAWVPCVVAVWQGCSNIPQKKGVKMNGITCESINI